MEHDLVINVLPKKLGKLVNSQVGNSFKFTFNSIRVIQNTHCK